MAQNKATPGTVPGPDFFFFWAVHIQYSPWGL